MVRGCVTDNEAHIVLDYVDHDLRGLLDFPQEVKFTPEQKKYYMRGILIALEGLHSRKIIHRDLKSANVLIGNDGTVQLADFGLARVKREGDLTPRVVTSWYRAPEVFFGDTQYTEKIDIWSAG